MSEPTRFATDAALPGPVSTHAVRRAALRELAAAGWPSRKREAWRYTNLEPLATADYDVLPPAPGHDTLPAARRTLAAAGISEHSRIVLLDGQRCASLDADPLLPLETSEPEERWDTFASHFVGRIDAKHHPLAALNTAFTQRGLWLRVPARTQLQEPIHLVLLSSVREHLGVQPRVVIEVEEDASITLIQHFLDCDDRSTGWVNAVTQLRQAARSKVELHRFQRHNDRRIHTSLLEAELAADAALTIGHYDLGGKLVRNDTRVTLAAPNASTALFGLFLAGADQHIDNHTVIDHAAGATRSFEDFRSVIGNGGRGVFNGKIVVRHGAQRIEAAQRNDNLLLGANAEIDTKPELEIYAHDVKCSHGATVGELDAEQLFYLRTRGVAMEAARELLVAAFANVLLDKISHETVRSVANELVTARLKPLQKS